MEALVRSEPFSPGREKASLARWTAMNFCKLTAEQAIALGQADVLASRVTPRQAVSLQARLPPASVDALAERAVVWSNTARDNYLGMIGKLRIEDPERAVAVALAIDRVAEGLGQNPKGVSGRVAYTWEKAVPGFDHVLVFELVTWTKAGDVIAIDALLDEPGGSRVEVSIL